MTSSEPLRIIIVDDEKDFVEALGERLKRKGFEVKVALNGEQALRALASGNADVMILDLKMPEMDGLEVLRRARQIDKAIRVVILTGHGTVEAGLTGLETGADDFVQKPCDIEALCDTLKVLGSKARRLRHELARSI